MTNLIGGELESLFWISAAAAIAPILVGRVRGPRIPEVVLLLCLGIAIGPYGFELAYKDPAVGLLSEIGLGLLFLMAGLEIDPGTLATRDGARAAAAWSTSIVTALLALWLVSSTFELEAWPAVAIALTSTALGALVPILRDAGLLDSPVGRRTLVNGAVGELGPILAMSVLLTASSALAGITSLALFALLAALLSMTVVRRWARRESLRAVVHQGRHSTAQTPIRLVVLLLVTMLAMASEFGLDIILGAFVAGATVRLVLPEDHEDFLAKLDGLSFGFLIPVFFITSGMAIDIGAVVERIWIVALLFALIVLVRGLPVLVAFRGEPSEHRLQLALFSATGLPIIVAVTTVVVDAGSMTVEGQSLIVAAGMVTVLVLPMAALALGRRSVSRRRRTSGDTAAG